CRIPLIPRMGWAVVVLGVCVAASSGARADEIRLKDGAKIVGTIVGYENDAFKVETAYGFALVRKANIAEIVPSAPASSKTKPAESAPPKEKESEKPAAVSTAAKPATAPAAPPAEAPTASAAAAKPAAPPVASAAPAPPPPPPEP